VDADASDTDALTETDLFFRLCPRCTRTVPGRSKERYCINDGEPLLESCPVCRTRITNPYGRHCAACGFEFTPSSLTPHSEPPD
jgi:hypothetical protein